MVYFLTVLLLVHVSSVLANDVVSPESLPNPVKRDQEMDSGGAEGALDVDDSADDDGSPAYFEIYDYSEDDRCREFLQLNKDLAAVFASMTREMELEFIPNCTEINVAAQYFKEEGEGLYNNEKTHVILLERTPVTDNDVYAVVFDEFRPVLEWQLREAKLEGQEIQFGCAWGDLGILCYYRKDGVQLKVVPPREESEEEEDESSGGDDGPREFGSVHEGQDSDSQSEEDSRQQA